MTLEPISCDCNLAFATGKICKHIIACFYFTQGSNLFGEDDDSQHTQSKKPDRVDLDLLKECLTSHHDLLENIETVKMLLVLFI